MIRQDEYEGLGHKIMVIQRHQPGSSSKTMPSHNQRRLRQMLPLLLVITGGMLGEAFVVTISSPAKSLCSSSSSSASTPPYLLKMASSDEEECDGEDKQQKAHASSSARPVPKPFITKRMKLRGVGGSKKDGSPSSKEKTSSSSPTRCGGNEGETAVERKAATDDPALLKVSKKWACIAGCGACCYLAPAERPYLLDYFDDPDDLAFYNSLVGEDGWCHHFDKEKRACSIFEDRPWFCRVEAEAFDKMYGVIPKEMDRFCTSCCREQIGDVYGVGSAEMLRFNVAIKGLKASDKAEGGGAALPIPVDPFTGVDKPENKADWI